MRYSIMLWILVVLNWTDWSYYMYQRYIENIAFDIGRYNEFAIGFLCYLFIKVIKNKLIDD